jgi:hypothetical protein
MQVLQHLDFVGDLPGHPFRGNQWTSGEGGRESDTSDNRLPSEMLISKGNTVNAALDGLGQFTTVAVPPTFSGTKLHVLADTKEKTASAAFAVYDVVAERGLGMKIANPSFHETARGTGQAGKGVTIYLPDRETVGKDTQAIVQALDRAHYRPPAGTIAGDTEVGPRSRTGVYTRYELSPDAPDRNLSLDEYHQWYVPSTVLAAIDIELGEGSGHPFRGNQWTEGEADTPDTPEGGGGSKETEREERHKEEVHGMKANLSKLSPENAALTRELIAKIPADVRDVLNAHGVTFDSREKATFGKGRLDHGGYYDPNTHQVVLSNKGFTDDLAKEKDAARYADSPNAGSAPTVLHETGHAFDYALGQPSKLPEFRALWKEAEPRAGSYFQKPFGGTDPREELFAEAAASIWNGTQPRDFTLTPNIQQVVNELRHNVRTGGPITSQRTSYSAFGEGAGHPFRGNQFTGGLDELLDRLNTTDPNSPGVKSSEKDQSVLQQQLVRAMSDWQSGRRSEVEVRKIAKEALQHNDPAVRSAAQALYDHLSGKTLSAVQALEFGEGAGHPFRGNQWTSGEEGGDAPSEEDLAQAWDLWAGSIYSQPQWSDLDNFPKVKEAIGRIKQDRPPKWGEDPKYRKAAEVLMDAVAQAPPSSSTLYRGMSESPEIGDVLDFDMVPVTRDEGSARVYGKTIIEISPGLRYLDGPEETAGVHPEGIAGGKVRVIDAYEGVSGGLRVYAEPVEAVVAALEFGEGAGHPFRGNQHVEGAGEGVTNLRPGSRSMAREDMVKLRKGDEVGVRIHNDVWPAVVIRHTPGHVDVRYFPSRDPESQTIGLMSAAPSELYRTEDVVGAHLPRDLSFPHTSGGMSDRYPGLAKSTIGSGLLEFTVMEFGDLPGHPFRGNQHTGGQGGEESFADRLNSELAGTKPWTQDFLPPVDSGFETRLGRCYELAGSYAIAHQEASVVHGTIKSADTSPLNHAWNVNPDGTVHEPATDRDFTPTAFERLFSPTVTREYTGVEATVKMLKAEHYGPWDDDSVVAAVWPLEFGESEGHPFRGNQWTTGEGGGDGVPEGSKPEYISDESKTYQENNAPIKAWEAQMFRAIALGKISQADAEKKGYFQSGGEKWAPLPEHLYHVTTSVSGVEESGLKSRDELGQGSGKGLGGGVSNMVSFTTDPEMAQSIADSVREFRDVARGEITTADLFERARTGEDADRPYIDDLMRGYSYNWERGDPIPIGAQDAIDGTRHASGGMITAGEEDEVRARLNERQGEGDWQPILSTKVEGAQVEWWAEWKRPATEDEKREDAVEAYKRASGWREQAGGRMDPLFFSSDWRSLAKIKDSDIGIVEAAPKAGAQGMQMSALGEWRTPGYAVDVVSAKTASGLLLVFGEGAGHPFRGGSSSSLEFGEDEGHPFRGNQWTSGETGPQIDVYAPIRFDQASLSSFDEKMQGKIVSQAEKKFGVTYEEGKAHLDTLLDDAKRSGEWDKGMTWYQRHHDAADSIAQENDIPTSNVIAAFAAMSPGNDWNYERPIVETMAEFNGSALKISDDRLETLNAALDAAGLKAVANGDKYEDMDTRSAVFAMKRQFDEEDRGSWGVTYGYLNFEKALDCIRGADPDEVLGGVKVRSFYNNLNDPSDPRDVTIDVQMVQAWANDFGVKNDPSTMGTPSMSRKGIGKTEIGPTPVLADAVREIAVDRGILPLQAQAIIWGEWKRQNTRSDRRDFTIEFGEGPGHPFRGNQYTEGESGDEERGVENANSILSTMVEGRVPSFGHSYPLDQQPGLIWGSARNAVKAEIVNARSADIVKEAETNTVLADQLDRWGQSDTSGHLYVHESGAPLSNFDRLAVQWQIEEWTGSRDPRVEADDPLGVNVTMEEVLQAAHENPDRPSDQYLMAEQLSQAYVDMWAQTAADHDGRAWAMQDVVAREMDAESSSFRDFLAERNAEPHTYLTSDQETQIVKDLEGEIMASFVRSEYNATQTWLREQGIKPEDPVRLYRGMKFPEGEIPEGFPVPKDLESPDRPSVDVSVDLNPASSWSVSQPIGQAFALSGGEKDLGYILTDTVLAKDIISTSLTGRGAIIEAEVLVRNREKNDITVAYA